MTFLKQLRDRARTCSNIAFKDALKDAADALDIVIDAFTDLPTEDNLRKLNGMWAYAWKVLQQTPDEGTPAPLSGSTEPARLAA